MRFHLVDRIDAYESGVWIRARKLTSAGEEFWETERGRPVMPMGLVLESLLEAGGWLIVLTTGRRKRAALASIGRLSISGSVEPGDVLTLSVRVTSLDEETAVNSGEVTVDGHEVLSVSDVMSVLIPIERLEDPVETARQLSRLTRRAADEEDTWDWFSHATSTGRQIGEP